MRSSPSPSPPAPIDAFRAACEELCACLRSDSREALTNFRNVFRLYIETCPVPDPSGSELKETLGQDNWELINTILKSREARELYDKRRRTRWIWKSPSDNGWKLHCLVAYGAFGDACFTPSFVCALRDLAIKQKCGWERAWQGLQQQRKQREEGKVNSKGVPKKLEWTKTDIDRFARSLKHTHLPSPFSEDEGDADHEQVSHDPATARDEQGLPLQVDCRQAPTARKTVDRSGRTTSLTPPSPFRRDDNMPDQTRQDWGMGEFGGEDGDSNGPASDDEISQTSRISVERFRRAPNPRREDLEHLDEPSGFSMPWSETDTTPSSMHEERVTGIILRPTKRRKIVPRSEVPGAFDQTGDASQVEHDLPANESESENDTESEAAGILNIRSTLNEHETRAHPFQLPRFISQKGSEHPFVDGITEDTNLQADPTILHSCAHSGEERGDGQASQAVSSTGAHQGQTHEQYGHAAADAVSNDDSCEDGGCLDATFIHTFLNLFNIASTQLVVWNVEAVLDRNEQINLKDLGLELDHTQLIVPMKVIPGHWLIGFIDLEHRIREVYDPYQYRTNLSLGRRTLSALTDVIDAKETGAGRHWTWKQEPILLTQSLRNHTDCGIYILVVGVHRMLDLPVPVSIVPYIWRRAFFATVDIKADYQQEYRSIVAALNSPDHQGQTTISKQSVAEMLDAIEQEIRLQGKAVKQSRHLAAESRCVAKVAIRACEIDRQCHQHSNFDQSEIENCQQQLSRYEGIPDAKDLITLFQQRLLDCQRRKKSSDRLAALREYAIPMQAQCEAEAERNFETHMRSRNSQRNRAARWMVDASDEV